MGRGEGMEEWGQVQGLGPDACSLLGLGGRRPRSAPRTLESGRKVIGAGLPTATGEQFAIFTRCNLF